MVPSRTPKGLASCEKRKGGDTHLIVVTCHELDGHIVPCAGGIRCPQGIDRVSNFDNSVRVGRSRGNDSADGASEDEMGE
jgi:hypothetical protein